MAFYKLNRKYLPTFIFLMDSIEEKEVDVDYQEIADFETKKRDTAHKISINRAFSLRIALKQGWEKKPGLPLKSTLNVLAAYFEEDESFSFLRFHLKYGDQFEDYFKNNKPKPHLIAELFPERADKIIHLEQNLETMELYVNELETKDIVKFTKGLESRFENFHKKMEDELKMKTACILYLEKRVNDLEATLKRAEFLKNILGAVGLFFVSIDYGSVTEEALLGGFFDDYDGFDLDDDILDDLL